MAENFPQHEPDDEPQVLSFEGLSQAFAKALSRKKGAAEQEESADAQASVEDSDAVVETDAEATQTVSLDRELGDTSSGIQESEAFESAVEVSVEESDDGDESLDGDEVRLTPHSILEAMLFVDDPDNHSLEPARAAALMRGVEPEEIETMVADLNHEYRLNHCPYEIISTGSGFRLVLREAFYPIRDKFYGRVREARLSQAAIDTLALVAYRQPISSDEVNKLRDKPSGHILAQLVRRRLLRVERTDTKPRKTLYYTTDRFLELFGLDSPGDLPQIDEMDD